MRCEVWFFCRMSGRVADGLESQTLYRDHFNVDDKTFRMLDYQRAESSESTIS